MKIRKGFVTNSSSSSFIIGKRENESVTIESVYRMIREFYLEYLGKRDAFLQYLKDNPKIGLEYKISEDGRYYVFRYKKDKTRKETSRNHEIDKQLKRDFGICSWDYFSVNDEWLTCETYEEYEKYWLDKMNQTKDWRVHAPFTIADFFEEKKINWLHYKPYDEDKTHKVNSKSDVLGWYYSYAEDIFNNSWKCEECPHKEWCDPEKCEEQKVYIEEQEIPEEKACLYMLGRICVYSECGYIYEYVVDKLIERSEYSCNHMG